MIHQIGTLVVSVTAGAIVCAIILSLFPESSMKSLIRVICGIFVMVTVLCPMVSVSLPNLGNIAENYIQEGKEQSLRGKKMAIQEQEKRIREELEAYILDKAALPPDQIEVRIQLDTNMIPSAVRICANMEGEERQKLEAVIADELGIAKENQQWTGQRRNKPSSP